jgi:hypothetical protein
MGAALTKLCGGLHYYELNSQATSVTRRRAHRPAITACYVFWREICRAAFRDFCNTIGQEQTYAKSSILWASRTEVCISSATSSCSFHSSGHECPIPQGVILCGRDNLHMNLGVRRLSPRSMCSTTLSASTIPSAGIRRWGISARLSLKERLG